MQVVFIHGWSVTNTETYGALPAAIAKNSDPNQKIQTTDLYLGKYISFADEVNIDDIARGMQHAINTEILPKLSDGEKFCCITHSTGGPVVRKWMDLYFKKNLEQCPLSHLIMLAPANHGSALAQLGKGKLSRMKFFAEGVQPGSGVLDWLELGSEQSWELNKSWLDYQCSEAGIYVFSLTGQTIDRHFYDAINSYTGEAGSDGVVRVTAANMNYGLIRLIQQGGGIKLQKRQTSEKFAFGILPGRSHSGEEKGIMRSVKSTDDIQHPTVHWVLRCLSVDSQDRYAQAISDLATLSAQTQAAEKKTKESGFFIFDREFTTSRYCMFIFRLVDDRNNELKDYDVYFTAGPNYDANHLPKGFCLDRQCNSLNTGKLTYYVDYDLMSEWFSKPELNNQIGFEIRARPTDGYAYYTVASYQGKVADLQQYFAPNQTVMIEIQLERHVTEGVFQLTQNLTPQSFKDQAKGGELPPMPLS